MIVYNLTDKKNPSMPPRRPKNVRLAGRIILPGKSEDIPDYLLLPGSYHGLVRRGYISVGSVPEWYQKARRAEADAKTKAVEKAPKQEKADGFEPVTTVKAVDLSLDDVVKPKSSSKKKSKK